MEKRDCVEYLEDGTNGWDSAAGISTDSSKSYVQWTLCKVMLKTMPKGKGGSDAFKCVRSTWGMYMERK